MVNIAVLKIGNIGVSPLFEFLFDERAERKDIAFRVFGSGSKMVYSNIEKNISALIEWNPDLVVFITPNASLKTPKEIINNLLEKNIKLIVISDSPALKDLEWFNKNNLGYIFVTGDPMIGARKEFLDPTEVAVFNADIIKVLSCSGVLGLIQKAVDRVIMNINKKDLALPKEVVDPDYLLKNLNFNNPYSKVKALASYYLAELVGKINVKACFKIKEWEHYTLMTAIAHEILNAASKLAEDSRSIEKFSDRLIREPHDDDGKILKKYKLLEKPK